MAFWGFFVCLENTWVKCFRFQPQAPFLDCPEVKEHLPARDDSGHFWLWLVAVPSGVTQAGMCFRH